MVDGLLTAQEVSTLVGVTTPTLNSWYRWKALEPDHNLAKLLPEYTRKGNRRTRLWKQSDVYKIAKFKANLPIGRNGILAAVTQRYTHKKEVSNVN